MLAGTSGCMIPKLRTAQTELVLPATYDGPPQGTTNGTFSGSASRETLAQLRVDEFYKDPILVSLQCESLRNNRELKILEEEVEIARAVVLARRGAYLPSVGVRAGLGWDRNSRFTPVGAAEKELEFLPGRRFPATPGDWGLGLSLAWPLDIWRELRNLRDAAIHRYYAALERRNDFINRLMAEIAQEYFRLMALDQRLALLDRIIQFQQESLKVAQANLDAGRDTDLPVRRFEAEVRKNQSEKLIVRQEIVEVENRINALIGRPPQPVPRNSAAFLDWPIPPLSLGVPTQLLLNRPDVRRAERELAAAGLDILAARARFLPRVDILGVVATQAFHPKYLFQPESLVFHLAGELAAPLINRAALQAEFRTANALQLQALYDYQRVIIQATIEVVNAMSMIQNLSQSLHLQQQQLQALEAAVAAATRLWQFPREKRTVDYLDVLTSQRDLLEARNRLIDIKLRQLSAIADLYQALGGGTAIVCPPAAAVPPAAERVPPAEAAPLPAPRPVDKPPANAPESPLSGTPQAPESPLPPRRANPEIRTDPQEPAAPADKPSR
jgi:NodT family efflux transporter outer membrane factor (OMF) lipoprotein